MDLKKTSELLHELALRANKINYKNKIPSLPINPTESTMRGFRKRLSNWTNTLTHIESERMRGTIKSDPNLLKSYSLK